MVLFTCPTVFSDEAPGEAPMPVDVLPVPALPLMLPVNPALPPAAAPPLPLCVTA
jgi:hypothetical protein